MTDSSKPPPLPRKRVVASMTLEKSIVTPPGEAAESADPGAAGRGIIEEILTHIPTKVKFSKQLLYDYPINQRKNMKKV